MSNENTFIIDGIEFVENSYLLSKESKETKSNTKTESSMLYKKCVNPKLDNIIIEQQSKREHKNTEKILKKVIKPTLSYLGTSQHTPQIKQFEKDYNRFFEHNVHSLQSKINYLWNLGDTSESNQKEIKELKQSNKRIRNEYKDNESQLRETFSKRLKKEKDENKNRLHVNSKIVEKLQKENIIIKRTVTDLKLEIHQQKKIIETPNIKYDELLKKYNEQKIKYKKEEEILNQKIEYFQQQTKVLKTHNQEQLQQLQYKEKHLPQKYQQKINLKSDNIYNVIQQFKKEQQELQHKHELEQINLLQQFKKEEKEEEEEEEEELILRQQKIKKDAMNKATIEFKKKHLKKQKFETKEDEDELIIIEEKSTSKPFIYIN